MNDKTKSFSIKNRINSFRHAIDGVVECVKSEHNMRVHIVVAIIVIVAGLMLTINTIEWCLIIIAIAFVIVSETINTAIELVCDAVSPEFHPLIKKSKDVAAGAVLLSSVSAVLIGIIIFYPYIVAYF